MRERVRQGGWSIQAQFLLYSAALLIPALVFSGLMIVRSASLERVAMEREINDVVGAVALAIDRELAATTTTLNALASSPALTDGDLKAFLQSGDCGAGGKRQPDRPYKPQRQASPQHARAVGRRSAATNLRRLERGHPIRQVAGVGRSSRRHGRQSAHFQHQRAGEARRQDDLRAERLHRSATHSRNLPACQARSRLGSDRHRPDRDCRRPLEGL